MAGVSLVSVRGRHEGRVMAGVAPTVEQGFRKPQDGGSNPLASSTCPATTLPPIICRGVACHPPVKEVVLALKDCSIVGEGAYLLRGLVQQLQRLYSGLATQCRTTDLDEYEVVLAVFIKKKGTSLRLTEGE